MTRLLFREVFNRDLDAIRGQAIFCGDSPNDAPMFGFFPHAVGVANVRSFANDLKSLPAWVTRAEGGYGFAEMVNILLDR